MRSRAAFPRQAPALFLVLLFVLCAAVARADSTGKPRPRLEVRVASQWGINAPDRFVPVFVQDEYGRVHHCDTDTSGFVAFDDLPQGRVRISAPEVVCPLHSRSIAAGDTARVFLMSQRGYSVTGRAPSVTPSSGRRASGTGWLEVLVELDAFTALLDSNAIVHLKDGRGCIRKQEGCRGDWCTVRFGGIPPGAIEIWAALRNGAVVSDTLSALVEIGDTTRVELETSQPGAIKSIYR